VPDQGCVALTLRNPVFRDSDHFGVPRQVAAGRLLLSAVLLALVSFGLPADAASHDGVVGIFVEPDVVSPGGVVVVRGDGVSTDDPVQVDLIAGGTRVALGTSVTDGEGHFTIGATVPTELAVGTYTIEVTSASGVRMTDFVQVEGAPIFDPQNGAPPGRDEGLPARPAAINQTSPGAAGTAGQPSEPAPDIDLVPLAALLAAIGALALFIRGTRRPSTRQAESAELP